MMRMTGFCYVKRLMADSGISCNKDVSSTDEPTEDFRERGGLGMMSYDEQTEDLRERGGSW